MVKYLITGGSIHFRLILKQIRISLLALTLMFFSCTSNTDDENEVIDKLVTITIEKDTFNIKNDFIGSNESCNALYVIAKYQDSKNGDLIIEFRLTKKGAIQNISFVDFRKGNIQYESADFNPLGLISITNFVYDANKKYLHFEFDGDLIKEDSNYDSLEKHNERKHIKGEVTIKNVKETNCESAISDLSFHTESLNFLTNTPNATHDTGLTINPYEFRFYSDNGFRILIKSSTDLWNLQKGTYNFTEKSIENRVDFEKYVGIFRATQLLWVREIDWKKYQTSGNYTIHEHIYVNGMKITKGEINLQVLDNGTLKYQIKNAKFDLIGF